MGKRCFVISPIGKPDSPEREHADDVFEFIIKPAMDDLGITVYRSDHNSQLGRITNQMFESLLDEDLCIAVLTGFNPNVFYELAIAQCAARPVIMMIEKGLTIPFDVRDLRAVEYDLRPRPLRDRVYVKQIIEFVRNLDAVDWRVEVPFGTNLSPLGNRENRLIVYDRVEKFGDSERWLSFLRSATRSCDMSGASLRWWTRNAAFRPTLLQKAEEGCKIRLLIMHAENPAFPQMINETRGAGSLRHLTDEIAATHDLFVRLSALQPNIEVRQVRVGTLTHLLVKSDDAMLFSLILYSQGTAQSPLLECVRALPLFGTIEAEFDALWAANAPPEEAAP